MVLYLTLLEPLNLPLFFMSSYSGIASKELFMIETAVMFGLFWVVFRLKRGYPKAGLSLFGALLWLFLGFCNLAFTT